MTESESCPSPDIERVAKAQERFSTAIEGALDDAAVRRPSHLPGWSVGHVLTHVARNADSHSARADAATAGMVIDQYPGGYEGRAAAIDAGAARPARELIADVRASADRLMSTWANIPVAAWDATTRDVAGRERPLNALPSRRWQELEVHVVDLDIGLTHEDWSAEFVSVWLPRLRASVSGRLPAGATMPTDDELGDAREQLAWLYGRLQRPGLPTLDPWA